MHRPTDRITHTTAFVTPVVEHWLERAVKDDIAQEKLRFGERKRKKNLSIL